VDKKPQERESYCPHCAFWPDSLEGQRPVYMSVIVDHGPSYHDRVHMRFCEACWNALSISVLRWSGTLGKEQPGDWGHEH